MSFHDGPTESVQPTQDRDLEWERPLNSLIQREMDGAIWSVNPIYQLLHIQTNPKLKTAHIRTNSNNPHLLNLPPSMFHIRQ
jgi:hypothetical protein